MRERQVGMIKSFVSEVVVRKAAMLRADGSTSSASSAVEAVREEFFQDYWEDARQ